MASKSPTCRSLRGVGRGGSIDGTAMARGRRFGRGLGPGQRHGMDRRETCEIPLTSTWGAAGIGSPAEQPTLAWAVPSGGPGALRRGTKRGRSAWAPEATLVHGGERDRSRPAFLLFQATRTDSGRPRLSIRLSALTAIWVSTCWAGPAWERKVSPITRLYRLMAASALAL